MSTTRARTIAANQAGTALAPRPRRRHRPTYAFRLPRPRASLVPIAALIAAPGWLFAAFAHADPGAGADLLDGSTHALVLGPTFIPNPDVFPGYMQAVDIEYLQHLGFAADGTLTALVTPESPIFGPSIAQGVDILVNAVEAAYNENTLSAADPLTVVGYSQSTVIASLAEEQLAANGIPLDDLRFVLLGDATADPSSGATGILDTWGTTPLGQDILELLGWSNLVDVTTPNHLYPTDVFNVVDDFWATTVAPIEFSTNPLQAIWDDFVGFFEHGSYLGGLPESEIVNAIAGGGAIDGATTYFTMADPGNLLESMITTALTDLGILAP